MKSASLRFILISLTVLFVLTQIIFFAIHYQVSDLLDILVKSSIGNEFTSSVIYLPIVTYLSLQIIAYSIFLWWIFFLTNNLGQFLKASPRKTYWLGILLWCSGTIFILSLNSKFYPHSFFAFTGFDIFLSLTSVILITVHILVLFNFFRKNKKNPVCWFVVASLFGLFFINIYESTSLKSNPQKSNKPNIIIIGFDSVRPDSINHTSMPTLNSILTNSQVYKNALTPLARTLPAWMSLLTATYPKHNDIRANLAAELSSQNYATLSSRLQEAGYETFYGTDESRYTDITNEHGFDHIIGPKGGAAEFLLGSLYDFPLSNLLLRLPGAHFLFPYNYSNRAADITYQPDDFVNLLKWQLAKHQDKPLFLALHLTLSHWPFTWAQANSNSDMAMGTLYQESLTKLDEQFAKIYRLLADSGLLTNSILILISDHGVTLGEPNDRLISQENYHGAPKDLHLITRFRLARAASYSLDSHDFVLNTSYGQGTDVLSLPQYHVLMAIKAYGVRFPTTDLTQQVSLMDIAPTLLEYLKLQKLPNTDGNSLFNNHKKPFFIETADVVAGMETDKIDVNTVIKNSINVYALNQKTGALYLKRDAYKTLLKHKQRAIIWNDWMLAKYPSNAQIRLVDAEKLPKNYQMKFNFKSQKFELTIGSVTKPLLFKTVMNKPYYVLLNLKTKQWTINLDNEFAKKAPTTFLLEQFKKFYGKEV